MNARESYSDGMKMLLQGNNAAGQATAGAHAFARAVKLTSDELARLCIVIEELVVNLYDHGGLVADDQVELTVSREPEAVRVIIFDRAVPFDPRSAPAEPESPERGGGAGIDIVRAWAKIVDYKAADGGNRLELLVPLGPLGRPSLSRRR